MLTWTSPVLPKLKDKDQTPFTKPIDSEQDSWIGSSLPLGAVFGPYIWGYLSNKIGRKKTVLLMAIPFIVAYITLAFARTIELYYFSRFLSGISTGGVFIILPALVSEISEDAIRGALSSSLNTFVILGTILSYTIGPYVSLTAFNLISCVFPVLFCVLFFLIAEESPFYLIQAEKYNEAEKSLMLYRARSSHYVQIELNTIKATVNANEKASIKDIFRTQGNIKALFISLSLMFFQQFSGINIILINTQNIFEATGSSIPSDISAITIGIVALIASFAVPSVVDKWGRRVLFLISAIGMSVAESMLGAYFYLKDDKQDVESIFWLPIISLILYVFIYNLGFGPLPWTVLAEVFPENIKATASSYVSSFCWLLAFILSKVFNSMSDSIGIGGTFWVFTGFNVLAIIFVAFWLPETKGKSFLEIQKILNS